MKIRSLTLLALNCLTLLLVHASFGQTDWPTLGFTQLGTNTFNSPTCITHAGDGSGRLFVLEQTGRVWVIINSNVSTQPFLDITDRVLSGGERGLLGLAFSPGYATNGHFYVDYTRQTDGATVISRFYNSTNTGVADPGSEQVLKVIAQPFPNHNGGQLAFGPDGYLYIGMGDGGYNTGNGIGDPFNNAQNLGSLLGKILRIDVESGATPYAIPPNNPFVGTTNAPEIWAYGLRNPWRFSFDRQTGDLYIGDVGHFRFEEVDFQPANSPGGQNYGWRILEATNTYNAPAGFDFSTLTPPVFWYDHLVIDPVNGSACIIGGYVYRGPSQPRLDGNYLVADYLHGNVWALRNSNGSWQQQLLLQTNFAISTFGEDDQGQLYISDYKSGHIYQVQDTRKVFTPVFNPAGSTDTTTNATITCLTPGAVIHYTTNGVDPTELDPVASGPIPVTLNVTNKARAFRPDLQPSAVAVALYTRFQAGTPTLDPPPGPIASNTIVTISTVTPGATIYYTTNGTGPTTNSQVYSGPLTLSGTVRVLAFATAPGFTNSTLANALYTAATVATPKFLPSTGPVTNGTLISMFTTTSGANIYYTLDGSTPTPASLLYTGPVTINGGTTVKAIGVKDGYVNSAVQSTFYQLVSTATPTFSPAAGPITNQTPIAISCATPNSTIYYTIDGSVPTNTSPVYSQPFLIDGGATVRAYASADQHLDSAVKTVFYQLVQTASPVFTPASGPITNGTSVAMSCSTPGSTIYYTIDGTTPTTNSSVYSAPLVISGNTTVNAFATASEHLDSTVNSTFFPLVKVATPTFSPGKGPLTNGSIISISTTTPAATIFYTTDGSDPLNNSNALSYSNPILFTNPVTITARAYSPPDFDPSPSTNIYFGLLDMENTVVTTFAGHPSAGFSNAIGAFAAFSSPQGLSADPVGNLYVADTGNNVIRKISPDASVSTYAGTGIAGYHTGPAATAQFTAPTGVTADTFGNVYVADGNLSNLVFKIDSSGTVSLFAVAATFGNFDGLWQLHADAFGDIYVGCWSGVLKFLPDRTGQFVGGRDSATCYQSWCPQVAPAADSHTNCYAATAGLIWKLPYGGSEEIFSSAQGGFSDGPHQLAQFAWPQDLFIDPSDNIYVSDSFRVRKIKADGNVVTLAGDGTAGYVNGRGSVAQFNYAIGICVTTNGNIFVADIGNNCIRKISPDTFGIGIADDWQIANFGRLGIDPNADPDHDGMSNYAEFWCGTDPNDAASVLAIDRSSTIVNGKIQLQWHTVPGKTYVIQSSSDLITWTNVGARVNGDGNLATVSDPIIQQTQRYYRLAITHF